LTHDIPWHVCVAELSTRLIGQGCGLRIAALGARGSLNLGGRGKPACQEDRYKQCPGPDVVEAPAWAPRGAGSDCVGYRG
jgi:hypothetical protein